MRYLKIGWAILELTLMFFILLYSFRTVRTRWVIQNYFAQERWQDLNKEYSAIPPQANSVIMFGDSMTEMWQQYKDFPDTLINMGISGDFTEGLILRMDNVTHFQPKELFLMIGINDIVERVPLYQIKDNYRNILITLQEKCPDTKIHIQSILPTTECNSMFRNSNDINEIVRAMNFYLQELANEFDLDYIDLYPHFINSDDLLKEEFNYGDGIHLKKSGYDLWEKLLLNHLRK